MKRHLLTSVLFFSALLIVVRAEPVILDFSLSHTVEDLQKSGLEIREIVVGSGQTYSFMNQEVEIRLPAGRTIRQSDVSGIINAKGGILTEYSMTGDVMPQDQAVKVAQAFIKTFGLSPNTLNQWETQNRDAQNVEAFSISANLNFYPRIGIGIKPSMNGIYPCVVSFSLSWNWDKQRDWNEQRAWQELSPPLSQFASISLNPPSGLKYERREAYKEIIAENEALQAKLKNEPSPTSIQPANVETKTVAQPIPVTESEPNRLLILGAVMAVLLGGGGLIWLLRKPSNS
jgi:hypothetical protein